MNRSLGALGVAAFVLASVPFVLTACEGPAGPPGASGMDGPAGSSGQTGPGGPQGQVGSAGPAGGADGGMNVGCMTPCHGFNGVVDQWKTSIHFMGAVENSDEVPSWTGPGTCGNCHASDALAQRLQGNVGFVGDAGPTNVTTGEINYRNASGGASEATYRGRSKVAVIGCTTCHEVSKTNDPHVTGALYAPGNFPLRVPSGATDQSVIEKSGALGTVGGTPAGNWGPSNTCGFCHKSRKDVTHYIAASNTLSSAHWGPHEAPQSDIFSGRGGYHFSGKVYGNSSHQTLAGCTSCHMPKVAGNSNVPDHSMHPTVASCQSAGCHANATSFDVLGGQSKVKSALGELRVLLNNLGYLTRSEAAPYLPLAGSELTDGALKLDKTRPGSGAGGSNAVLTADQAGALYNYMLLARGSGWGVHNPVYTSQLLFDSVFLLKGSAPAAIPARP